MSAISSNSAMPGAGVPLPQPDAGAASAAPLPAAANPDLLKELADMAATLTEGKRAPGGDGVANARGAPALQSPAAPMSAGDMIDLLRSIRSKSQDAQLAGAKESLQTARINAQKNNEQQAEKIKEWVDKCKEADSKGILGKIFGWIGKIFAVIASAIAVAVAAAATVASAGAAAPMLALATLALVGSTISLADQISQECGGPQISIGNLLGTIASKFLEACGVDKETAEKIGKVMAGVAALAMPVTLLIEPQMLGTMATGICELAGADPKATAIVGMVVGMAAAVTVGIVTAVASGGGTAVSSAVKIANGVVTGTAQVVQGLTAVGSGAVKIAVAKDQKAAEDILASKKELDAMLAKLQQQMEDGREEIKKVLQQMEDGVQAVSQMINGAADSMAQITSNLGKRVSV
ncbi:type III secretion system translocon subunit SctE [Achromobacter sp. NPDC058515]|uniref:type III secretion system translocon subunit SctE n=1 Tax=Achromobacter sp. NPDC058515 TaxID=3346533 RepID=UPI003649E707